MQLRQEFTGDAALVMTDLQLNDTGHYRCEVVDGLEDKSTTVHLELRGAVSPPGLKLISILEIKPGVLIIIIFLF